VGKTRRGTKKSVITKRQKEAGNKKLNRKSEESPVKKDGSPERKPIPKWRQVQGISKKRTVCPNQINSFPETKNKEKKWTPVYYCSTGTTAEGFRKGQDHYKRRKNRLV